MLIFHFFPQVIGCEITCGDLVLRRLRIIARSGALAISFKLHRLGLSGDRGTEVVSWQLLLQAGVLVWS
jgi:hypothetical protein